MWICMSSSKCFLKQTSITWIFVEIQRCFVLLLRLQLLCLASGWIVLSFLVRCHLANSDDDRVCYMLLCNKFEILCHSTIPSSCWVARTYGGFRDVDLIPKECIFNMPPRDGGWEDLQIVPRVWQYDRNTNNVLRCRLLDNSNTLSG